MEFKEEDEPLSSAYFWARKSFHEGISSATDIATDGLVYRASFSDCAYLVYKNPKSLLRAINIAMSRFSGAVPVRGGVGMGNFGLGKNIHISDSNSSSTEASFYGSSIVRAHQAESCGLKGFRIFVHSSAARILMNTHKGVQAYPIRDWSDFEEGDPAPPRMPSTVIELNGDCPAQIEHEVCYIASDDIDPYFRGLEMVKRIFPPNDKDKIHFVHTELALKRFNELREESNQANSADAKNRAAD